MSKKPSVCQFIFVLEVERLPSCKSIVELKIFTASEVIVIL